MAPLPEPDPGRDLNPEEFAVFRKFLLDSSGILLGEHKQYLVKNRLSGLLRDNRYDLAGFVAALRSGRVTAALKARVIDAMTTNETFWFRETAHFDELREVLLPAWMAARGGPGPVRIWSAACSTGQEPYSISLCVEEFLRGRLGAHRPVQILGTDISGLALAEAGTAAYSALALSRGLEPKLRDRYFTTVGEKWRPRPEITARVRFQAYNLLAPYAPLGKFDLVFCRNVLIYFPEEVKRDILARLAGALNPGGLLFLSSTENLPPGVNGYETVRGKYCRYYRTP